MRYFKIQVSGIFILLAGCATSTGPELGLTADARLQPCPASPNCVSSDESGSHSISPLAISDNAQRAWLALVDHIETQPRFEIVTREASYLRAEARTRLFRFVDDVEFHLRPAEKQIAIRSASRIGYSDLGTNRRRLEAIREALAGSGVVEAGN